MRSPSVVLNQYHSAMDLMSEACCNNVDMFLQKASICLSNSFSPGSLDTKWCQWTVIPQTTMTFFKSNKTNRRLLPLNHVLVVVPQRVIWGTEATEFNLVQKNNKYTPTIRESISATAIVFHTSNQHYTLLITVALRPGETKGKKRGFLSFLSVFCTLNGF